MHDNHLNWFTCCVIPQILISYYDRFVHLLNEEKKCLYTLDCKLLLSTSAFLFAK